MKSLIGKLFTVGDEVYEAEKASRHRESTGSFDEFCWNSKGTPCAFLVDGKCSKPSSLPECYSLKGKASIVYLQAGVKVTSGEVLMHPDKDYRCYACGTMIPGVGTSMDVDEELKEQGAAHFVYHYVRNGKEGEYHICCLCELIAGVMGRQDGFRQDEFYPRSLSYKAKKAKEKIIEEFKHDSLDTLLHRYVWKDELEYKKQ